MVQSLKSQSTHIHEYKIRLSRLIPEKLPFCSHSRDNASPKGIYILMLGEPARENYVVHVCRSATIHHHGKGIVATKMKRGGQLCEF